MKQFSMRRISQKIVQSVLLALLLSPVSLYAQTDSAAAVAEEESLISPSLDFIAVQKSDNTIDLKAAMQAKIKGSFHKLRLLKISFVQVSDTAEKALGFVITDEQGKAVLNVKAATLLAPANGNLSFKAVFSGNKQMEAAEGETTFKRGVLEIRPVKEDSLLTVNIKLLVPGAGADSTLKDLSIGLFVKRSFNPLKIGEGTTDENGELTIEVPANLPGNDKGDLTLFARLDDNEVFGNMEATTVQQWGIPVSDKLENQPRALWSAHPPLWMLITFIVLMSVVWGHYIVIVYQLFRLRKEEPAV
jgi:hypothetical protein